MKKSMKIIFMVLAAIFVPFPFGVALAVFLGFKVPTAEDQINDSAETEYIYGKDLLIKNPKIRKLIFKFSKRKEKRVIEFFEQLCMHNFGYAEILNRCNERLLVNQEVEEAEKLTVDEWLLLAELRANVRRMLDEYHDEFQNRMKEVK